MTNPTAMHFGERAGIYYVVEDLGGARLARRLERSRPVRRISTNGETRQLSPPASRVSQSVPF
jgi:hypothetical protein